MRVKFLDIIDDITRLGRKIPTDQYRVSGKHPIIDQGQADIAGYFDCEDGLFYDVPAIIFGDHTRILKYIDTPCFLGADGTKLLKAKNSNANHKYLFYALTNIRIPDTGYNRHFKWLKECELWIPSLDNQQKIVTVLDKVSELISKRKQQLTKLDELVKSRFIELFGTYPENQYGWDTATIRDIVSDVRYGSSRPAVEGGAYPYLRMNNITYGGELDLAEVKRIDVPESELPKCTVRCGDVLFNRTNSRELVGKTCVYNRDEAMVLAGFVIRVRVNERVLPEFLSAFLNTDFSKQMLFGMCKAAIGQANINAQEMQNIGIYVPPIEMQRQFILFKQQTDKSKLAVQNSLDKLETLKKSLMQQYFG